MSSLNWENADEIGYRLSQRFPDVDPLSVRFTDLHRWVIEMEDFGDAPEASSESSLEAIQMVWLEYYGENR
ncbi:MAG: Fe-S cluster assembly protein IscX [Phycisphaerae bacterium]|nr:Fe-S cluster assembly protein IscX [Phycisphaerae bacterium]